MRTIGWLQRRLGIALLLVLWLPLLAGAAGSAGQSSPPAVDGIQIPNPASDLWRAVRQRNEAELGLPGRPLTGAAGAAGVDLWGELEQRRAGSLPSGNSQVSGVQSGTLINAYGDLWRDFRMQRLIPYGGWLLAGVLVALLLFYLVRGKVRIEAGTSDRKLFRYSVNERMIHWFMALLFLFLAFTGLLLLFGRSLLLPWLGPQLFSIVASASKEGHNLFGPLFLLALLLMFVKFARRNIYQKGDLTWLLRGGGIIGRKHVPSNFFNMGEKSLFWLLVIVGGVIVASGLVLLFPVFGQGREWMTLSHIAHAIGALVMVSAVIGHIYIGTIGMEGALEVMKSGYCDLNWARAHHDWWAEKCVQQGKVLSADEVARSSGEVPAGQVAEQLAGKRGD